MSKAFVKESHDEADLPDPPPPVPAGFKNYMTPRSHRHMQDELRQLLRAERPKVVETVAWAAGNGDRSENGDYLYGKRRLREIDRRIRFLTKRLENAEVVGKSGLAIRGIEISDLSIIVEFQQEGHLSVFAGLPDYDSVSVTIVVSLRRDAGCLGKGGTCLICYFRRGIRRGTRCWPRGICRYRRYNWFAGRRHIPCRAPVEQLLQLPDERL